MLRRLFITIIAISIDVLKNTVNGERALLSKTKSFATKKYAHSWPETVYILKIYPLSFISLNEKLGEVSAATLRKSSFSYCSRSSYKYQNRDSYLKSVDLFHFFESCQNQ